MIRVVTPKHLAVAALAVCAILCVMAFTGCGRELLPAGPNEKDVPRGPAGVLAGLAIYATWAAGVGLLLCGVAAIWATNKFAVAKVAVCCIAVIGVSCLLHWLAGHTAILLGGTAAILLLTSVGYVWLHRADVKRQTGIDLNWFCRMKAPVPPPINGKTKRTP